MIKLLIEHYYCMNLIDCIISTFKCNFKTGPACIQNRKIFNRSGNFIMRARMNGSKNKRISKKCGR